MLYELILDPDGEGVRAISLVEMPAIEENWIALSAEEFNFSTIDEERRLVMGAVLVPDKPIKRINGEEEFYVYFSKETIRAAMERYAMSGNHRQTTLEHQLAIQGVTTIESWIVEDESYDKSAFYKLKAPVGSWIATLKIDSDEIWNNWVKTGRVKGFSIEGLFRRKKADEASAPQELSSSFLEELERALSNKEG